jgi:hypothetical protein
MSGGVVFYLESNHAQKILPIKSNYIQSRKPRYKNGGNIQIAIIRLYRHNVEYNPEILDKRIYSERPEFVSIFQGEGSTRKNPRGSFITGAYIISFLQRL